MISSCTRSNDLTPEAFYMQQQKVGNLVLTGVLFWGKAHWLCPV